MADARKVSFDILMAVERGGFAADLLAAHADELTSRDAGLAAAIVLGVLRYRRQIDYLIQFYSGRSVSKLDPEVLNALRMGVFQLRYLDRIPPHAAVDASVELIKRAKKRSAAGFANAVLRKVTRDAVAWPDRATELSHPEWMLARWGDAAREIALANLEVPERFIRVPPDAQPPHSAEQTEIPGCYRLPAGVDAGGFRIQDIGSQSVVPLLNLQEGMRYLDLCAAPGNKTAQAMETKVRAVAGDVHMGRLRGLRALGVPLVQWDAERPLPFGAIFDRVLVDAPCSGTGTLRHNPEIKWRLQPEEIERFRERQSRILENALAVLAPGGMLVYSTCSLEKEENEDVIAGRTSEILRRIPGRDAGDGFFAARITDAF